MLCYVMKANKVHNADLVTQEVENSFLHFPLTTAPAKVTPLTAVTNVFRKNALNAMTCNAL